MNIYDIFNHQPTEEDEARFEKALNGCLVVFLVAVAVFLVLVKYL